MNCCGKCCNILKCLTPQDRPGELVYNSELMSPSVTVKNKFGYRQSKKKNLQEQTVQLCESSKETVGDNLLQLFECERIRDPWFCGTGGCRNKGGKVKIMDERGFDPLASRMRSARSTK